MHPCYGQHVCRHVLLQLLAVSRHMASSPLASAPDELAAQLPQLQTSYLEGQPMHWHLHHPVVHRIPGRFIHSGPSAFSPTHTAMYMAGSVAGVWASHPQVSWSSAPIGIMSCSCWQAAPICCSPDNPWAPTTPRQQPQPAVITPRQAQCLLQWLPACQPAINTGPPALPARRCCTAVCASAH